MTEWWTYSLRDLLLFSPQTYYRLFELYNREWWPLQVVALALGLSLLILWRRGGRGAGRAIAFALALSWLWVAWAYHGQRYATIHLAAPCFAWAFAIEALLFVWVGAFRGRFTPETAAPMQRLAGVSLFVFALLVYPALGMLMGRSWTQAEVFGMAPDPTALATLGVLLFAGVRSRWILIPIPFVWCLLSSATLWAMESPDFAIVSLAALAAVGVALFAIPKDAAMRQSRTPGLPVD